MNLTVEKYQNWVAKLEKNLQHSEGAEGKLLLSRFRSLKLREDILGAKQHAKILHSIVSEFQIERQNLRWVEKLERDCIKWSALLDSTLRATQLNIDEVVTALIENEIDIEFAESLA